MQAFEGIRVVDFTHVLAGPFCTYQLAVMGAEVIKIESPKSPDMMRLEGADKELGNQNRGTHFLAQGGNKKSVCIDFGTDQGFKAMIRLIQTADVLVENFRGGVMAKHGLDYESLKALNPTLIYCSMTGFGQSGPKAQHPAYDNVIQAYSGLMAQTGDTETAPVRVGPPVLDYSTGSQAAFSIAAALLQRTQSGIGQHIDVSMLDAALMLMSTSVVDTQLTHTAPVAPGNSSLTHSGYGCFGTSDGLIMIGAFTAKQHADLWQALGNPIFASQAETLDSNARAKRMKDDRALMAKSLETKSAQQWEDLLNDAGVPAARVRQLDETLRDPQVKSRQILQNAQGFSEHDNELKMPVAAFSYDHDGPLLNHQAPPRGMHTHEVLQELGYSSEELQNLSEANILS